MSDVSSPTLRGVAILSGLLESLSHAQLASLSDENLMVHLRRGYSDALAVLFDRYHSLIFGVASRILRDQGEAEDLMQSVFLEIFRSVAQYDESKGTPKVWISIAESAPRGLCDSCSIMSDFES